MTEAVTTPKVRTERLCAGAVWRVELDSPKGNVIDAEMTAGLTSVFRAAASEPRLCAIVLTASGDDFSFGASVEEHRADRVAAMLRDFHALFRAISASHVPVVAAVRGSCLGGGLEVAAFCHRVIAHPGARFGQPEIKLGVFAPVGSAILAERVGRGAADDLLLTGRLVRGEEALGMGLVDALEDDPETAALAWVEKYLVPLSAAAVRFATRAARRAFAERFDSEIAELERMYVAELMETEDAVEGIEAFLAKRPPSWRHR